MDRENAPATKPPLVNIADVINALAAQCDGARSKDGRGFNRADAMEGGRLSALKGMGIPWSVEDAKKALEIAGKYSKQAGNLLGDGREKKAAGIENALKSGKVRLDEEPVENQEPYNYACLSSGYKRAYLWRIKRIEDMAGLMRDCRVVCDRLPHGQRRTTWSLEKSADITINGVRTKAARIEIDFNGSSQRGIIALCKRYEFVIEPAMRAPMDSEVDALRMAERAAWIHRGVRDNEKGVWAVFDLARKHPPFSEAVKTELRGRFACDINDDWNWFVDLTTETLPVVRDIIDRFGFAASKEFAAFTPRD